MECELANIKREGENICDKSEGKNDKHNVPQIEMAALVLLQNHNLEEVNVSFLTSRYLFENIYSN